MRTFYRALRSISAVTLFFFVWSVLPLWQAVAYAAAPEAQGTRGQGPGGRVQGSARPEERFEKALDGIRENVSKAGEKAVKGEDDTREREAIKAKRADIESADVEFKKEFSATEKKLKDAKLPKEILDRHYKFVKHYEDNLKELRTNLDDIDTLKADSRQRKAAFTKASLHLARVKAPSKHQKLDPNNLPFRARKAGKTREPRLRKDEFERDFPQQKKRGNLAALEHEFTRLVNSASRIPHSALPNKPVQLAFNGPISDMPFQLPLPSGERTEVRGGLTPNSAFAIPNWDTSNADSSPFLLAQATVQPSADDLTETPDVQFTDAIRAKAQELGGKPLKIYEWVRNNIEYAPTYGSIQGADQCLQSKICNDMDTASLLIALLRVSGVYSHYEYSTIEIPIEQAMNWVGGVTDPKMVGTILATNSIPAKMLVSGGTYKAVQLEHVYVSAFSDYIPSRGAVHRQGDTWIPLDASFKQYSYTQGLDIATAVPFDAQTFANQIESTATINPDGSVTNVNSAFVEQAMQDYQTRVQNYIQQSHPNATVGDVIGKKEIIKQNYPILLGTLSYKTVQIGSEFVTVPDNLRETVSFSITDPTGAGAALTYTAGMSQIAGKKITLSFSPATANDQAIIESLLPQPNPDGSTIQPSQLPSSFPAYLINLKPELRIDGQIVTTGAPGTMGSAQPFNISLNEPGIGLSNIDNIVRAGEYYGIGIDTGKIDTNRLTALKSKLETTKAKIETQNYAGLTKDDVVGDLLATTIAAYFYALDANDDMVAKMQGVIRYRVPSVGMYSVHLDVQEIFGIPKSAASKGMMMDVDRIMQVVFAKDGNMDKVRQYILVSGSASSALENILPEQMYSTPDNTVQGISAIKALKIANSQGIPIYTVNQSNIATVLPQLQVGEEVKNDIANSVNAGRKVIISKSNITLNGWTGCGYAIIDPVTGSGAYMISGGQSGGIILYYIGMSLMAIGLDPESGEIGNTVASYGSMLMVLGASIIVNNPIPMCTQTFDPCVQACMSTLLLGFWPAAIGGSISTLLAMVELYTGAAAAATGQATAWAAFLGAPGTVAGSVLGAWALGSFIGCNLTCAIDPCSYQ